MAVAKVFKSGNSQAVRLPKEFRIKSEVVDILRRGNQIILTERPVTLGEALDRLTPHPDFFRDVVLDDPPPQKRKWL